MNAILPKGDRLNIGEVAEVVQNNCHISDAQYAGNYSLCIFLLKMREYYRWENHLPLSEILRKDDVGPWLIDRENHWDQCESLPFSPLTMGYESFDPFDSVAINEVLIPKGYVYSSGYGLFHKPLFFLARLKKAYKQDDLTILVSDCEYARELAAPPAMLQGTTIYIRQESLRRAIHEKIETWQLKKDGESPMGKVLACYGGLEAHVHPEALLNRLCDNETENVILHERGEAQAGKILGSGWEEMILSLDQYKTELMVRAIRDFLADCLVTLPALLQNNNYASLHFYIANLDPLRKSIFPELYEAWQEWGSTGNMNLLENRVFAGQSWWQKVAQNVLELHEDKAKNFHQRVEELALSPISE